MSAVVLNGTSGVARGFDFWEDSIEPTENQEALARVQRPGGETEALLSKWVEAQGDKPLFAFLHVYEPHAPYEPPEPFKSRFASPYDGEIATADAIVGRFLDRLKAKGIYDRAMVVFLSDHGEGLGEHGEDEHGIFLYREALQVPLLVKLPKGAFAGTSVSTPVSILDVFGTVVRAVGLSGSRVSRSRLASWTSRAERSRPSGGSSRRPSSRESISAGATSRPSSMGRGITSTHRGRKSTTSARIRRSATTGSRRSRAPSDP